MTEQSQAPLPLAEIFSNLSAIPISSSVTPHTTSQIEIFDSYYLLVTLLISLAYQSTGFLLAYTLQTDKLTDITGTSNFIILSAVTLGLSSTHPSGISHRQYLASLALTIWGARLTGFLFFKLLKTGSNTRFDNKHQSFFKFGGFWLAQLICVWTVSLPVTILNSPAINKYNPQSHRLWACEAVGTTMYIIGLLIEIAADNQKYRFRKDPANKSRPCDTGLWHSSRHPNYFGEMLLHFGIYLMTVAPTAYHVVPSGTRAAAAQVASIIGPSFLCILLLFVDGILLQERPKAKKIYEAGGPEGEEWCQYKAFVESTSILIPMPQRWWLALPAWVKGTLGFEWGIYRFVPERDADMAKVRQRQDGQEDQEEGDEGEETTGRNDSEEGLVGPDSN